MTRSDMKFAPAQLLSFIERGIAEALATGLVFQTTTDAAYRGRHVDVESHEMLNFAGCSYMGLEHHPALQEGAIAALRRYGTQFSFSRAYLELSLYTELEEALGEITGGHALVTPSTTAAHISAIPVLVGPQDAVMIDKYAHASLHTAIALLHGNPVTTLPHEDLDELHRTLAKLSATHRHVWYVLDGLYSMSGNHAPFDLLSSLRAQYPNLHFYIDDAHATSWTGTHGRGLALERFVDRTRIVVALSLNKAFAAAGGAVIFPTEQLRTRVRTCGGPMVFGGPVQPPMLGAAIASARLHLDPSFAAMQQQLAERITLMRKIAKDLGVPVATRDPSPIVNIECGNAAAAFKLVGALRKRGFFTSPAAPPAVPPEKSGVRFTLSRHNSHDDIRALMLALAAEMSTGDRPPRARVTPTASAA